MRIVLAALLVLATAPAFAADTITFDRASVIATANRMPVAGIAVVITNNGPDDKITAVRSTASLQGVLQNTTVDPANGQMIAHKVASIDIPGNGASTTLTSTGNYFSLISVQSALKAGTKIPVIVTFEKAGEKTLSVEAVTMDVFMKRFTPEMMGDNLEKSRVGYEKSVEAAGGSWTDRLRQKVRSIGTGKEAPAPAPVVNIPPAPAPAIVTGPMSTPDKPLPPEMADKIPSTQVAPGPEFNVKDGPDGPVLDIPKAPAQPRINQKTPLPNTGGPVVPTWLPQDEPGAQKPAEAKVPAPAPAATPAAK